MIDLVVIDELGTSSTNGTGFGVSRALSNVVAGIIDATPLSFFQGRGQHGDTLYRAAQPRRVLIVDARRPGPSDEAFERLRRELPEIIARNLPEYGRELPKVLPDVSTLQPGWFEAHEAPIERRAPVPVPRDPICFGARRSTPAPSFKRTRRSLEQHSRRPSA